MTPSWQLVITAGRHDEGSEKQWDVHMQTPTHTHTHLHHPRTAGRAHKNEQELWLLCWLHDMILAYSFQRCFKIFRSPWKASTWRSFDFGETFMDFGRRKSKDARLQHSTLVNTITGSLNDIPERLNVLWVMSGFWTLSRWNASSCVLHTRAHTLTKNLTYRRLCPICLNVNLTYHISRGKTSV